MIKHKKGVALIWALILCTILLLISGSMVTIIIKESKASVRIEDSTSSYAAAKTGVEWAENYIDDWRNGLGTPGPSNFPRTTKNLVISSEFNITADIVMDRSSDGTFYVITSKGKKGTVTREIYREYKTYSPTPIAIADNTLVNNISIAPNSDSFKLSFYMGILNSQEPFEFGVQSLAGKIFLRYGGGAERKVSLVSGSNSVEIGAFSSITTGVAYPYLVEITYVDDTNASLVIKEPLAATNTCVMSGSINLAGAELNGLNNFYTNNPNSIYNADIPPDPDTVGEGKGIQIMGGSPEQMTAFLTHFQIVKN